MSFDVGAREPGDLVRWLLGHYYPNRNQADALLAQYVEPRLAAQVSLLDAGCGTGLYLRYSWAQECRLCVGCDISERVGMNRNLGVGVQANVTSLPFASNSFDIIFSRYLCEQVSEPIGMFAEFARVLKPGGQLVLLTPSRWHYLSLLMRYAPASARALAQRLICRTLLESEYRANTKAELLRLGTSSHLTPVAFHALEPEPDFLSWSAPLFGLAVVYERIVNSWTVFEPFRRIMVVVFHKETAG